MLTLGALSADTTQIKIRKKAFHRLKYFKIIVTGIILYVFIKETKKLQLCGSVINELFFYQNCGRKMSVKINLK